MNKGHVSDDWIGGQVIVRLASSEAEGVEILATLKEKNVDGITLSDIGELGPGPTIFCPWDAVRDVRLRAEEASEFQEAGVLSYEESGAEMEVSEPYRTPAARTLERVVPVAQKQAIGGVTVALASLELYGEGLGVLQWRVSFDESSAQYGENFGIPEPWFEIRDIGGRELPWLPLGSGASDKEADGNVQVEGVPESGELEVEVSRLISDVYMEEEDRENVPSYEGPWTFRFSL